MHAGDEAQLQEISPVVGLLEAQQQPDRQQQQTAAEQYGRMGFFGSLCSAPPVNTPGAHPILLAHTFMILLHAYAFLLPPLPVPLCSSYMPIALLHCDMLDYRGVCMLPALAQLPSAMQCIPWLC